MYIIFSPLFYVNGDPHVGHRFSIEIINCIYRIIMVCGSYAVKYSGTDEHGDKIANTVARLQKTEPDLNYSKFLARMRSKFEAIYPGFNIYNTHGEYHIAYLRSVYKYLKRAGIIYEGTYTGYYCLREERYLGQEEITDARKQDINTVQREEKGLYMKIDKTLNDEIVKIVPDLIYNKHYHNEAISILSNAQDIFISRHMKHEAMVPIDDYNDLSFYVWFDAINYYNSVMALHARHNTHNIIVIGCDIMRFHLTLLLHISYYLYNGLIPFKFFVHGMITLDGAKVSKSLDNFESINEIANNNPFFFSSLIANGVTGEISVSEHKCEAYAKNIKNNVRNFYNRLIGILPLYDKFKDATTNLLVVNINSPHIIQLHKILQKVKELKSTLDLVQGYNLLNELSTLANGIVNNFELWNMTDSKLACVLECKVMMYFMIILEYILGHNVDNIIKKTGIETFCSIYYLYPLNFDISQLTSEDVLI